MAALLELVPELALGLILFAAFVSYCAGRGLLVMWQRTFGWMLLGIAGFLNWSVTILGHHVGFDFGKVFRAANNSVQNAIEAWIAGSEEGMARTLRAMTAVAAAGVRASEWLARETAATLEQFFGGYLPRLIKAAVTGSLIALVIRRVIKALMPWLRAQIAHPTKVIYHTLPGKVVTIVKRAAPVAIPGAVTIPAIWSEIHGLTQRNLRIGKRLKRLEKLLGVTGLAIAMANVFGLPNWRCLTRGNVGRTVRRLCGLDNLLLDALLADLGFMVGAISIVEFAKALQRVEPLMAASLGVLVDDLGMAEAEVQRIAKRSLAIVESIA